MNSKNQVRTYWNESWAQIETHHPTKKCLYYISNHGRIKSVDKTTEKESLLKGSVLRTGHRVLNIRLAGNRRQTIYIHKMVAKYFIKSTNPDHKFVEHIDQNKNNNHFSNLKWLTRDELSKTWVEKKIYSLEGKAKFRKNVKLTESKVRLIKKWLEKEKANKKVIAKKMDISLTQLKRIESGENWAHVTLENGKIKNV